MAFRVASFASNNHLETIELGIANYMQRVWTMPSKSVLVSPARAASLPASYYRSSYLVVPTARAPGSRMPSLSSTATSGSARSGFDLRPQTPTDKLVEADMRPISPALAYSLLMAPRVRCVELPPFAAAGSAVDETDDYERSSFATSHTRVEAWQHDMPKVTPAPLHATELRCRYLSRA